MRNYRAHILLFLFFFSKNIYSQSEFTNWEKGTSPQEVGNIIANRFLTVPHGHGGVNGHTSTSITYPEVCAWYGGLTFAQLTKNTALRDSLVKRYDKLINEETSMIPTPIT